MATPNIDDIAYFVRCATKRIDLPTDVIRTLSDAYYAIETLHRERDEARRDACELRCNPPKVPFFGAPQELAEINGWDCFKNYKENTND